MFKPKSPFLNIPSNTDQRQAFFLDGIRHAFEIADYAFSRLTTGLTELVQAHSDSNLPSSYAKYYLDAWAFVDAVDRLLALWKLRPNAQTIPPPWNPENLTKDLEQIRNIRNVSDHLASRAAQVISSGTASLGELSWITVCSIDPTIMKSSLIRPGFLTASIKLQMSLPRENLFVYNSASNILLKSHTYTANLSYAYTRIVDLANYAESSLLAAINSTSSSKPLGADLFAICDLEFPTPV